MPASRHLKTLSIRVSEPQLRRLKSVAALRGISMQDAVQEALEVWVSSPPQTSLEPLERLQGSLAEVDVAKLMREDRDLELAHESTLREQS